MRNRTSDLRILRSDATEPQRHHGERGRSSYDTRPHTAGISNVDSVVFVDRKIRERVGFELGREIKKDVFRFVTSVGQRKF